MQIQVASTCMFEWHEYVWFLVVRAVVLRSVMFAEVLACTEQFGIWANLMSLLPRFGPYMPVIYAFSRLRLEFPEAGASWPALALKCAAVQAMQPCPCLTSTFVGCLAQVAYRFPDQDGAQAGTLQALPTSLFSCFARRGETEGPMLSLVDLAGWDGEARTL